MASHKSVTRADAHPPGEVTDYMDVAEVAAPSTPASGKVRLYAKSDGNLYQKDDAGTETVLAGGGGGGGYTQGARAYNSADISISNNSLTPLTFNSERYDTDTIHSTGSDTGRLTCKTAGKYLIVGQIEFAANTSGRRILEIRLNGTTNLAEIEHHPSQTGSAPTGMNILTIYDLSVNDYVELLVYQSSGGSLNVNAVANYSPEFMMSKIG